MKKVYAVLMCVLITVSLCSCVASENEVHTVTKNGMNYVVDPANGTISDGTHTYQYELSGNSGGYSVNITYPDGSSYWWSTQSSGGVTNGYGGWSEDYVEGKYVDGGTLCDVLEEGMPEEKDPKNVFFALLLLAVGAFNAALPYAAWYLENGWRYKDAEPSDLALGLIRFSGIAAIIVAIIMIIL